MLTLSRRILSKQCAVFTWAAVAQVGSGDADGKPGQKPEAAVKKPTKDSPKAALKTETVRGCSRSAAPARRGTLHLLRLRLRWQVKPAYPSGAAEAEAKQSPITEAAAEVGPLC